MVISVYISLRISSMANLPVIFNHISYVFASSHKEQLRYKNIDSTFISLLKVQLLVEQFV